MAVVGALGLVGMMLKNGIVLVDEIRLQLDRSQDYNEAIIEASKSRMRPVMLASLTTVLGMVPLLFDDMFSSMVSTIMGGLVAGTFIVLIIIPVLYSLCFFPTNKKNDKSMNKFFLLSLFAVMFVACSDSSDEEDCLMSAPRLVNVTHMEYIDPIMHCKEDNNIPYEVSYNYYDKLSVHGTNPNVHWGDIPLPAGSDLLVKQFPTLSHVLSNLVIRFRVITKEYPEEFLEKWEH